MNELPENRVITKQLESVILGKKISKIAGNFTSNKFTFYEPNPENFSQMLLGKEITGFVKRNFYIEIHAEHKIILFRNGVNIRYFEPNQEIPAKSQLFIQFSDESVLNMTVSMYGFIGVLERSDEVTNEYYLTELQGIGALDDGFTLDYFSILCQNNLK